MSNLSMKKITHKIEYIPEFVYEVFASDMHSSFVHEIPVIEAYMKIHVEVKGHLP